MANSADFIVKNGLQVSLNANISGNVSVSGDSFYLGNSAYQNTLIPIANGLFYLSQEYMYFASNNTLNGQSSIEFINRTDEAITPLIRLSDETTSAQLYPTGISVGGGLGYIENGDFGGNTVTMTNYVETSNLIIGNINSTTGQVYANSTTIRIAGSTVNSTYYSGAANNTTYVGGLTSNQLIANSAAAYTNAVTYVNSKSYVNTSQLSANLALYSNSAQLLANVATSYTNAVTYVNSKSYVNTSQLSSNLALYSNSVQMLNNSAAAYSNAVTYVTNKAYVNTVNLTNNLALYSTTTSMLNNSAAAYANAVLYVDSKSYVNTAQLQANLLSITANSANNTLYLDGQPASYYTNAQNLTGGPITNTVLGLTNVYIGTTAIALNRGPLVQSLTGVNLTDPTISGNVTLSSTSTQTILVNPGNGVVVNTVNNPLVVSNPASNSTTNNTFVAINAKHTYQSTNTAVAVRLEVNSSNADITNYSATHSTKPAHLEFKGSNTVTVLVNGTEKARFSANGLSLGTNSSSETLTVNGTISATGNVIFRGTANVTGNLTVNNVSVTTNISAGFISGNVVTTNTGTKSRSLVDRFADVYNIKDFGAISDANTAVANLIVTSGSSTISTDPGIFSSGDVGKILGIAPIIENMNNPIKRAPFISYVRITGYTSVNTVTVSSTVATNSAFGSYFGEAPVSSFGFVWGTDNYTAIANAVSTANTYGGGKVYVPTGKYAFSNTIFLNSNMVVEGDGPSSILYKVVPVQSQSTTKSAATFTNYNGWYANGSTKKGVTYFKTTTAANQLDENITIRNLKFDHTGQIYGAAGGKTILFTLARNLKVENCDFVYPTTYGVPMSFIGCSNIEEFNNKSSNVSIGHDHWGGVVNVKMIGNYIEMANNGGTQAVNFNAGGTNTSIDINTTENIHIAKNTIILKGTDSNTDGGLVAILTDGLGAGNITKNVIIEDNYIKGDYYSFNTHQAGIVSRGLGGDIIIRNNKFENLGDQSPLLPIHIGRVSNNSTFSLTNAIATTLGSNLITITLPYQTHLTNTHVNNGVWISLPANTISNINFANSTGSTGWTENYFKINSISNTTTMVVEAPSVANATASNLSFTGTAYINYGFNENVQILNNRFLNTRANGANSSVIEVGGPGHIIDGNIIEYSNNTYIPQYLTAIRVTSDDNYSGARYKVVVLNNQITAPGNTSISFPSDYVGDNRIAYKNFNGKAVNLEPFVIDTVTTPNTAAMAKIPNALYTTNISSNNISANSLTIAANVIAGGGSFNSHNFLISPTANPTVNGTLNSTYSALTVQANTVPNSNNRHMLAHFGLTSSSGNNSSGNNKDNVTLYAGLDMVGNSGNGWAFNTVTNIWANCHVDRIAYGYELDYNNFNSDRSNDFVRPAVGLAITSVGNNLSTAALLITGMQPNINPLIWPNPDGPTWDKGVLIIGNTAATAGFHDASNANTSFLITGTHQVGIDFTSGIFNNAAITLPYGTPIKINGMNAMYGDGANNTVLGKYGTLTLNGNTGSVNINQAAAGGWAGSAAFESVATDAYLFPGSFYYKNTTSIAGSGISVRVDPAANSSSADMAKFYRSSTLIGSISTGSSSVAYNTTSDYRLKENITPLEDALSKIMSLTPVSYKWKNFDNYGEGFIAHNLQEYIPNAVTGTKDAIDENGNIIPQQVDYSKLVVYLVSAIQELKKEFDAYVKAHP